jgi:Glyoxalase-like domain
VADLDAAANRLEARYGLASLPGGRHPGWGTANRIVPLGETYVELVAVVDPREAAASAFGTWVAAAEPGRLLGWAVRTEHLDDVARRHGLGVQPGARVAQGGRRLTWRLAGVERAATDPPLPFWIEWGRETPLPGTAAALHPGGSARVAELQLTGDRDALNEWLGPHNLPISVRAGAPTIAALRLRRDGEDVLLDSL